MRACRRRRGAVGLRARRRRRGAPARPGLALVLPFRGFHARTYITTPYHTYLLICYYELFIPISLKRTFLYLFRRRSLIRYQKTMTG